MIRSCLNFVPAIVLTICFAGSAYPQDITPAEKGKALQYLTDTRANLAEAVKGLSAAQLRFKPAPDRWSVAEVVEHLAVLENFFANTLCEQLMHAPAGAPNRDIESVDAMILVKVPDRSTKVQAPDNLVPTGRWPPQQSLSLFLANRQKTMNFLISSTGLRGHVLSHPALGPLDAYQWLLAVAAHTDRHTQQILEVKADPHFPTN